MKELILVIEDDEVLRSNLVELLELEGFNVISAEDGLVGLMLAKEFNPDLILCDINIPQLDGYEVLTCLRADSRIAKTPFIFLTSETGLESRFRAQKLGANDYLTKPISIGKLMEAISTNLKIQRIEI
jgi:DNA-binding response OmpR family regulator